MGKRIIKCNNLPQNEVDSNDFSVEIHGYRCNSKHKHISFFCLD